MLNFVQDCNIIKINPKIGGETMGSMAFWYEKNQANRSSKIEAVMNFNLWTQCGAEAESFLDIGFMISGISAAKKLFYYIPFAKASVEDLSSKINKAKAIGAIFNEKYSVIDMPGTNRFWPVQDETEHANVKKAFVIYAWSNSGSDGAVTTVDCADSSGVCIEIDVVKIMQQIDNLQNSRVSKDDKFYFRFRVKIPDPKQADTIVRKYTPPNSFLQSTLATTYIVDFRFDDLRSLPERISDKIAQTCNEFVNVSKLHFFLMTKAHVDVETGARDISLRELEDKTWDEYIDERFETKDVVAFHCAEKQKKDEKPIRQWEFFAKIKVNNSTWSVVSIYLFALAVITVGLNFLSNWLWELII